MIIQNNYLDTMVYNVGLYLRLSREDEEAGQSMSIKNQKDYLVNYVLEKGWNITKIYIDDGYSGLNFDRPDFNKMIADIETKKINLVITKDLSRLGRDYIDTGYYLERYFPQKNIRYIALSDGIDTFTKSANNDMTPFKSVLNDMYAKDISKKIRTVMDTKRINGQFIGAFAPFGYVKSAEDKNKLLVDSVAAGTVKRIFSMYLNGYSMAKIALTLTSEKVPTPTEYKRTVQNLSYVNVNIKYNIWRTETIKRILTNPTYIGNMAQHRSEKISYKMKKFKKIPRKDWIIAENTHEAIISKEDFSRVQERIKQKSQLQYPTERVNHLLGGLIFCGDCKMPMTFRRVGKKKKEFICLCSGYSRFGKEKCQRNAIKEDVLNEYVLSHLKSISKKVFENRVEFYKSFNIEKVDLIADSTQKETEKILKRLAEIKKIIKSLYEDKVKGIVTEEDFLMMSSEFNEEKEKLSMRLAEIESEKSQTKEKKTPEQIIDIIEKIVSFDIISPLLIGQLIEKIEIYKSNEIVINYKFYNPFEQK